MWTDTPGGRILAAAVVVLGIAGIAVGVGGLYLTLTASDTPPDRGAEALGAFGCEPGDREARSGPAGDYGVDRVVADGGELESVGTATTADGARLNLTVAGELLNASASRFAGGPETPPNVTLQGGAVVVADPERAPFRLRIDAVSADGTVVRTELDVCPP